MARRINRAARKSFSIGLRVFRVVYAANSTSQIQI